LKYKDDVNECWADEAAAQPTALLLTRGHKIPCPPYTTAPSPSDMTAIQLTLRCKYGSVAEIG
jgi:hypothetical protein